MHLKPIPFNKIKIQSDFWSPRLETIQKKTIRVCLEHCEDGSATFARRRIGKTVRLKELFLTTATFTKCWRVQLIA